MNDIFSRRYQHRSPFFQFLMMFRNYKVKTAVSMSFFLVKIIPVWLTPIIISNIINELTTGGPGTIHRMLMQFMIGAIFIVQNVFTHVMYVRYFSQITRSVEKDLRMALCYRLQQLTIAYHTDNKLGVLQTKVLRDVENIEMLSKMIMDNIPNLAFSLGSAVIVTLIRAPQFVIFYIAIIPIAVIVFQSVKGRMVRYNREFRTNVEQMSGKVIEMLKLITITRAHNQEDDELERVNDKLDQVKSSGLKLDMINGIFGSINWVIFTFFNLLTLTAAAIASYKGIIPLKVGDVILLTTYFNVITGSVMQILNILPNLTKGLESVKSIGEILKSPQYEQYGRKPRIMGVNGEFRFDNVSFTYPGAEVPAIKNLSLCVAPGETIAFVGPSGSGKSTIMQLVIGFTKPDSGNIFLDGHNLHDIDLKSYRRFLSVVSQETVLFDGTIKDNITYGRDIPTAKIQQAIADSNLEAFLEDQPDGMDTQVKENGARLSGGQRQRLAIARALIRNPKVLVLDEATSALDVESEAAIQEALNRLIQGRTTFVVAHRLSTIRNADRIFVLDKGEIIESGNHQELLDQQGVYYKMHRIQNGETD